MAEQASKRWSRVRALPSDGRIAFGLAALAVAVLTVLEFTRGRQEVAPAVPAAVTRLQAEPSIPLPALSGITPESQILTDAVGSTNALFWSATGDAGGLRLVPVLAADAELERGRPARLPRGAPGAVDVGAWSGRTAIFSISPIGPRYRVDVHPANADRGGRESLVSAPLPERNGDRALAIATWSGTQPDLYVIDRSAAGAVEVRILEGESGFRRVLLHERPAVGSLRPDTWTVDVFPTTGAKPDVLFISRAGPTGSGMVEVHALSGASNYGAWGLAQPLDVPVEAALSRRFAPARAGGVFVMLDVDPDAQTVSVERL